MNKIAPRRNAILKAAQELGYEFKQGGRYEFSAVTGGAVGTRFQLVKGEEVKGYATLEEVAQALEAVQAAQ